MADVEKVEAGKELEYLSRNVLDDKVEDEAEDTTPDELKDEVEEGTEDDKDESAAVDEDEDKSEKEAPDEDESEDEEIDESEELDDTSVIDKIKKSFPKLLKEIPELRKIIYSEQQFTQSFATPEEAKEAREAIEAYGTYEQDLLAGESKGLIETLDKTNKDSLKSFLANFIPTVFEHNQDLALQMLYPEFKKMLRAASRNKNENISKSAENLHVFIFGDDKLEADAGLKPKEKSDGETDLQRREREFNERKAQGFYNDVKLTVERRLTRIIEKSLENTGLSTLAREAAVNKIASKVDDAVRRDKRFQGNLRDLGMKAKRSDFSIEGKDSIISAYLSRAKMQIKNARQEVLRDEKITSDKKKTTKPVRLTGVQTTPGKSKVNVKDIDWGRKTTEYPSGYSQQDYLQGKQPPLIKR